MPQLHRHTRSRCGVLSRRQSTEKTPSMYARFLPNQSEFFNPACAHPVLAQGCGYLIRNAVARRADIEYRLAPHSVAHLPDNCCHPPLIPYQTMQKILITLIAMILSGCQGKLDGSYASEDFIVGRHFSVLFKPDGTLTYHVIGRDTAGGKPYDLAPELSHFPAAYQMIGNKIRITGQNGDQEATLLENGTILLNGLILTKDGATASTASEVAKTPKSSGSSNDTVNVKAIPLIAPNNALPQNFKISSNADESSQILLNAIYGSYDKGRECWFLVDAGQRYCLKRDRADIVSTESGDRLYVLVTGTAVDEHGEPNGFHNLAGVVGAFIVEERGGKANMVASAPMIYFGAFGSAPTRWEFKALGSNDYWGWQNTTGDAHGGIAGTRYSILAPYGKIIRDLVPVDFIASYDDTNECDDCKTLRSKIESTLAIDSARSTDKIFPLVVTVTGSNKGKVLAPKIWMVSFDEKSWSYVTPQGWPLENKTY